MSEESDNEQEDFAPRYDEDMDEDDKAQAQAAEDEEPYQSEDVVDADTDDPSEMSVNKQGHTILGVGNPRRTSAPNGTKYEKARLIAARYKMIEDGCPHGLGSECLITDSLELAEEEFRQCKIPILIKRPMPGNVRELWSMSELKFPLS